MEKLNKKRSKQKINIKNHEIKINAPESFHGQSLLTFLHHFLVQLSERFLRHQQQRKSIRETDSVVHIRHVMWGRQARMVVRLSDEPHFSVQKRREPSCGSVALIDADLIFSPDDDRDDRSFCAMSRS